MLELWESDGSTDVWFVFFSLVRTIRKHFCSPFKKWQEGNADLLVLHPLSTKPYLVFASIKGSDRYYNGMQNHLWKKSFPNLKQTNQPYSLQSKHVPLGLQLNCCPFAGERRNPGNGSGHRGSRKSCLTSVSQCMDGQREENMQDHLFFKACVLASQKWW